jgi:hypothetical protein
MLTSEAVSSAAGLATGIDLLEPLGLFLRAQKQRSWAGKNIVSHRRANVMEKSKESHVLGGLFLFLGSPANFLYGQSFSFFPDARSRNAG